MTKTRPLAVNCEKCNKLGFDFCECHRLRPGPKTKASQGLKRHKKIHITLPPDLWEEMLKWQREDENISRLVSRLIKQAIT